MHSDSRSLLLAFFLLSAESGDVKATIAVLSFILSSAAKHNVDSESLSSELQQLGLPKGERVQAKGKDKGEHLLPRAACLEVGEAAFGGLLPAQVVCLSWTFQMASCVHALSL